MVGTLMQGLAMPVHLLALATGAKSFRDNPILGSRRLNRWGLHTARLRLAHHLAGWRRRRLQRTLAANDLAAFERDGFVVKEDFLPDQVFEALRLRIMTHAMPARDTRQGDTITRRIAVDGEALSAIPELSVLTERPEFIGLMRYAGASRLNPLVYIQTIFARVYDREPDPQTELHSDTFHPTAKAWFFLEDLEGQDAAFTYVPGSHRLSPERLYWEGLRAQYARGGDCVLTARGSFRVAPETLPHLGLPEPRVFPAKANTLIIADTSGFHRRSPSALPTVRCEIWAYGRRSPFLPWLGGDLTALPGVRRSVSSLVWRLGDAWQRLGGRRNPWRAAGRVTPKTAPDLDLHFDAPGRR